MNKRIITHSSTACKILVLILIFIFHTSKSQVVRETQARITNIDFELVEDQLVITYDLVGAKDWEIFDIEPHIFSASTENEIDASTFSGDISGVRSGRGKKITWDIQKDITYLEGNIYVKLDATPTNPKIIKYTSKTKATLYSTLYPGWGSAKTTLNNANYIKGIVAYSMLGLSIKYNLDARNNYDRYLDANEAVARDDYFDQAESNLNTSRYLLAGAISVWVIDYAWILIMPNRTESVGKQKTSLNMNVETMPFGLAPGLKLTYNF